MKTPNEAGERRRSSLTGALSRGWRQARRWLNLLIGLVFLTLAGAGATVTLAEWHFYRQDPATGMLRFDLLAGFTVILVLFGLYSFAKARSVR